MTRRQNHDPWVWHKEAHPPRTRCKWCGHSMKVASHWYRSGRPVCEPCVNRDTDVPTICGECEDTTGACPCPICEVCGEWDDAIRVQDGESVCTDCRVSEAVSLCEGDR